MTDRVHVGSPEHEPDQKGVEQRELTRRRFVAWIGAGAAALAAGGLAAKLLTDNDDEDHIEQSNRQSGQWSGFEPRLLSMALPPATWKVARAQSLTYATLSGVYPLMRQNKESWARLRDSNRIAALLDRDVLTHYVGDPKDPAKLSMVLAPRNQGCLGMLWADSEVNGEEIVLGSNFLLPPSGQGKVVRAAAEVTPQSGVTGLFRKDIRLTRLGLNQTSIKSLDDIKDLEDVMQLVTATAGALVFGYPAIRTLDPTASAITMNIINQTGAVRDLANTLLAFLRQKFPYGRVDNMVKAMRDGREVPQTMDPRIDNPLYEREPDEPVVDPAIGGLPARVFSPFLREGMQFNGDRLPDDLIRGFRTTLQYAIKKVTNRVMDTSALGAVVKGDLTSSDVNGKTWVVTPGKAPETISLSSGGVTDTTGGQAVAAKGKQAGDSFGAVKFSITGGGDSVGGLKARIKEVEKESVEDGEAVKITIEIANICQRTCAFGAQFFDGRIGIFKGKAGRPDIRVEGIAIRPRSAQRLSDSDTLDPTWNIGALLLASPATFLSIPVTGWSNSTEVVLYLPPDAMKAKLIGGSMGTTDPSWRRNFLSVKRDDKDNEVIDPETELPILVEAYPMIDGNRFTRPQWYSEAYTSTCIVNLGFPAAMMVMQAITVGMELKMFRETEKKSLTYQEYETKYPKPEEKSGWDVQRWREKKTRYLDSVNQDIARTATAMKGSFLVSTVLMGLLGLAKGASAKEFNPIDMIFDIAKMLLTALAWNFFVPAMKTYLTTLAESTAAKLVPYLGQAYIVAALAANTSQITQASVEVGTQPDTVTWDISGSYDVSVSFEPEEKDKGFSRSAATWTLVIQYDAESLKPTVVQAPGFTQTLAEVDGHPDQLLLTYSRTSDFAKPRKDPIKHTLNVRFGGKIRYLVQIYSEDAAVVGSGQTDWIDNGIIDKVQTDVHIVITEQPVELSEDSRYQRKWTVTQQQGKYDMTLDAKVPETILTKDAPETQQIAVGDNSGTVTYVYRAVNSFKIRQMGINDNPGEFARALVGDFGGLPPRIVIDPYARLDGSRSGPGEGKSRHWLLEPIKGDADGGYLIRKLTFNATEFSYDRDSVYGKFLTPVHDVALAPTGELVAINSSDGKLPIIRPATVPLEPTDSNIPTPTYYSGPGNSTGEIPGLLFNPISVTVAGNGVVVVLEQKDQVKRLQSFNLFGNPVEAFTATSGSDQIKADYYIDLGDGSKLADERVTYLDVSSDLSGFVMLLGYQGDGSKPDQYVLDVFAPGTESRLFRVPGFNASKISVGLFREIYSANYQALTVRGEKAEKQPSTSIWIPRTPNYQPKK